MGEQRDRALPGAGACLRDSELWPSEPHARANIDRWMDAQQTVLNRPMGGVFWGLVRTPADKRDPKVTARGVRNREGVAWRPPTR